VPRIIIIINVFLSELSKHVVNVNIGLLLLCVLGRIVECWLGGHGESRLDRVEGADHLVLNNRLFVLHNVRALPWANEINVEVNLLQPRRF